ncbi:MAG: type II toxin-antitoxin system HicB family antitoxin [Actinomycetota bacterium]
MKTYTVVIERDESGAWIARVPGVPGCHTYGRTLQAARRRIREALGLWVPDAERAKLEFDVRLPREARDVVRPFRAARRRAEEAQREAQEALGGAAGELVRAGFSLRDAGELLGLSHQRVAQVAAPQRPSAGEARPRRRPRG